MPLASVRAQPGPTVPHQAHDGRGQRLDLRPLHGLLHRLEQALQPEQIWLFGSRARGTAGPESDWDLLVIVPDATEASVEDPSLGWSLQRGLGVPADIVLCRYSDFLLHRQTVNTLSYDVQREGLLVYER